LLPRLRGTSNESCRPMTAIRRSAIRASAVQHQAVNRSRRAIPQIAKLLSRKAGTLAYFVSSNTSAFNQAYCSRRQSPPIPWAQHLNRDFKFDVETCRVCGGAFRVIACIEDPGVIERILNHLNKKTTFVVPTCCPKAGPRRNGACLAECQRRIWGSCWVLSWMKGTAAFVLWTGNHHRTGLNVQFHRPDPLAAVPIRRQKHWPSVAPYRGG